MSTAAWLREAIRKRIAELQPPVTGISATCLTEPPAGVDLEHWDRCCDRCSTWVPQGETLYCGLWSCSSSAGGQLLVTYGLCPACVDAEMLARIKDAV